MQVTRLFRLVCLLFLVTDCHGMAVTSNNKASSGGAGFGASKTAWKTHITDDSPSTQRLLLALAKYKADVSNVEIGFSSTPERGRGLFAMKQIGKGKIICKVPSDCALALLNPNALTAPQSTGRSPTSSTAQLGANLWNLYLNHPTAQEQWSWYLATLPSNIPPDHSTPNLWSNDDEINLLEFPRIVQTAHDRKLQLQQVAVSEGISERDLHYATWLVTSRSFAVSVAAGSGTEEEEAETPAVQRDERGQVMARTQERASSTIPVLVPLLDMVNHNGGQANARWTILDPEKDDAWFALEAIRPIAPGKEITLTYGAGGAPHSSVELLSDYGFVPPTDNIIDSLILRKGGADVFTTASEWSTTVDEDRRMLEMLEEEDHIMRRILLFRIRMKEAQKQGA